MRPRSAPSASATSVNAVALVLPGDPRPAIAARVLFDLSDAARYGRGNPRVLAMTAGFAAFGALGLLGTPR